MIWPFDSEPPLIPSGSDLEQDEREARWATERAIKRKHAARRRAGLPEVELPNETNGFPF